MRARFTKGDRVEFERDVSGAAAYFPATVVHAPSASKKQILIEHETLTIGEAVRIKEYVDPGSVRPSPPREFNRWFKVGDEVDAFREGDGCWVEGNVRDILENSRYLVGFNGGNHQEIEFDHFHLRLHREWDGGAWVPPLPAQDTSGTLELMPKRTKLKITFSSGNQQVSYSKGDMVEVRSDEEGYKGSWYCGFIFNHLLNNKFIVEYLTLKRDDDESVPLREVIEAQYMRPCPPPHSPVVQFKRGDEVDAWYNEGWWVGTVSKVLNVKKYIVYFSATNEDLEFPHSCLRLHQDWINGQWLIPSKKGSNSHSCGHKPKQQGLKPKERLRTKDGLENTDTKFTKGMKVEVRSDERGYEGSWYSATIVNYKGYRKYEVEYHTLKTDDETEFLREEAKASDIRPCPPPIQRVYPYDLYECVDAWFNEGWWYGQVYKIFSGMKYAVYFKNSNEQLEFAHSDLRPHQEWKNGEWTAGSKDCLF